MAKEDIISIAREAGLGAALTHNNGEPRIFIEGADWHDELVRFAELLEAKVRADEREKSLQLWMLLDDVDTADDIAKSDDAVYRSLCRQAHQKRWAVLTGDEVDAIRARGEK